MKKKKSKEPKITIKDIYYSTLQLNYRMLQLESWASKLDHNMTKLWAELYADVKIVKGLYDEKEKERIHTPIQSL